MRLIIAIIIALVAQLPTLAIAHWYNTRLIRIEATIGETPTWILGLVLFLVLGAWMVFSFLYLAPKVTNKLWKD